MGKEAPNVSMARPLVHEQLSLRVAFDSSVLYRRAGLHGFYSPSQSKMLWKTISAATATLNGPKKNKVYHKAASATLQMLVHGRAI